MAKELDLKKDSLGEIALRKDCLWGPQTERALHNFRIGDEKMPLEVIHAIALIKNAASKVNYSLGLLSRNKAEKIIYHTEKILSGELDQAFPLSLWQSGSGTQSNMNVNEVVARMSEADGIEGAEAIHANDDVNMGQSSNDVFPTAMHISSTIKIHNSLLPSLKKLEAALNTKAKEFHDIIKIGRTHMQDAVPIRLGQEFSAYGHQVSESIKRINLLLPFLKSLAQGGTAVGTGLNTHNDFPKLVAQEISKMTKLDFYTSQNKFASISSNNEIVAMSGELNTLATSLHKIANDIRFLASGPRAGIGEISLPKNEPGSSIMPGKVNPTQCEMLTMVCAQVMGNHHTIAFCASQGHLELNVYRPLMIHNFLQSIRLLSDACNSFADKCVIEIKANIPRIKHLAESSLMLATALNKKLGYDIASKVAIYADENKITLREACLELGELSGEEFDSIVNIRNMV